MSPITLNGSIGTLLDFYRHERRLWGRCPLCDSVFRVSEVKLTFGKEPPKDALTQLRRERLKLQEQLEAKDAEIAELEETHEEELDSLQEHFSAKFEMEVDKRLARSEREIRRRAIERSRAGQLGKTLEKIAPMFPGFKHHPYDVRPVFDPIDFIVFDGYFNGSVSDLVFVEFKTGQSRLSPMQSSIRKAIENKRVHFEEKRLDRDALKALTARRPRGGKNVELQTIRTL